MREVAMSREMKIGLTVTAAFLALVGVIDDDRMRDKTPPDPGNSPPQQLAAVKPNATPPGPKSPTPEPPPQPQPQPQPTPRLEPMSGQQLPLQPLPPFPTSRPRDGGLQRISHE